VVTNSPFPLRVRESYGDGRADDGVGERGFGIGHRAPSLLDLPAQGIDFLLPRPQLDQFVGLLQRVHAVHRAVVAGLRVIRGLLRRQPFLAQFHGAVDAQLGILHIGLSRIQISLRLRHFFRPRAVQRLGQLGFQIGHLPPGLLQLRLVFVVFQTHDHLAFLHAVALVDADPLHLADDFGGYFDAMRRHDVAGRVEHHSLRRAGRADGADSLDVHHRRGIEFIRKEKEPPSRQENDNQ